MYQTRLVEGDVLDLGIRGVLVLPRKDEPWATTYGDAPRPKETRGYRRANGASCGVTREAASRGG